MTPVTTLDDVSDTYCGRLLLHDGQFELCEGPAGHAGPHSNRAMPLTAWEWQLDTRAGSPGRPTRPVEALRDRIEAPARRLRDLQPAFETRLARQIALRAAEVAVRVLGRAS